MTIDKKKKKKKTIPKESKKLKYLYFIVVLFQGEYILKFGISNNYRRRFKEYNNSLTVGYYNETLDVFKMSHPKRVESMLKWAMVSIDKPKFKYEYFNLNHYGYLRQKMYQLIDEFKMDLLKIE